LLAQAQLSLFHTGALEDAAALGIRGTGYHS